MTESVNGVAADANLNWKYPGCYFRSGLEVRSCGKRGGLGVFTTVDLAEGDIIVVERSLLALHDPAAALRISLPQLMPRRLWDKPWWLFGWPAGLLLWSRAALTFMKMELNSFWGGIFAFGALFNHSCEPNAARHIWDDGWSVLFCLRPVTADSEICISYGHAECGVWLRRFALFMRYGFFCRCPRCCTGALLPPSLRCLSSAEEDSLASTLTQALIVTGSDNLFMEVTGSPARYSREAVTSRSLRALTRALRQLPNAASPRQRLGKAIAEARACVDGGSVKMSASSIASAVKELDGASAGAWAGDFAAACNDTEAASAAQACFRNAMIPVMVIRGYLCTLPRRSFIFALIVILPTCIGFVDLVTLQKACAIAWVLLAPWLPVGILVLFCALHFVEGLFMAYFVLVAGSLCFAYLAAAVEWRALSDRTLVEMGPLGELAIWQMLPHYMRVGVGFFATYGLASMLYEYFAACRSLGDYAGFVGGLKEHSAAEGGLAPAAPIKHKQVTQAAEGADVLKTNRRLKSGRASHGSLD